jgi:hypothetical protein
MAAGAGTADDRYKAIAFCFAAGARASREYISPFQSLVSIEWKRATCPS